MDKAAICRPVDTCTTRKSDIQVQLLNTMPCTTQTVETKYRNWPLFSALEALPFTSTNPAMRISDCYLVVPISSESVNNKRPINQLYPQNEAVEYTKT